MSKQLTAEQRRERIMSLVPEDALLLDQWEEEQHGITVHLSVYGDGECCCVITESHLEDGPEDGRTAFNGITFGRGKMLQRVVQALQTAEDYTGKVQG